MGTKLQGGGGSKRGNRHATTLRSDSATQEMGKRSEMGTNNETRPRGGELTNEVGREGCLLGYLENELEHKNEDTVHLVNVKEMKAKMV